MIEPPCHGERTVCAVEAAGRSIESLFSAKARSAPAPRPPSAGPAFKVNFDQGLPDPTLFPLDDLKRCLVETMELEGVDACKYFGAGGPHEMQYGYLGLRQALTERMARRDGRNVGSDGVLLVQGSTDGLALA